MASAASYNAQQLQGLKTALDTAEANKASNPAAYEQARIAYYTLKDGQSWLSKEKERLARDHVAPVLKSYDAQFNGLQNELKTHAKVAQLSKDLQDTQVGDEEDARFLYKMYVNEENKANAANRLFELNPPTPSSWNTLFQVLIALLGLFIVFQIAFLGKGWKWFVSQPTVDPTPPNL